MQKIKNERGITLITLVITIVVLLLISVPIVIKTTDVTKANKYIAFVEDITKLNESISQVYDLNSDISLIGPEYEGDTSFLVQKNINDNFTYYIIDCDKLNSELLDKYHTGLQKLEYGKNNYNIDLNNVATTDVYIINAQSRTIYYPDGIEHNGETLYRQQGDYTEITVVEDETPPTATITSFTNSTDYLFAIKAQVNITDDFSQANYGRCKYQFSADNTPLGTDEESYTDGTIARNGKIEKVKGPGTYYLHVLATDNKGNSSETVSTNTVTVASVADYDYVTDAQGNGKEQTAKLLPGTYQMECWGAQGSSYNTTYIGGKGGYTKGEITLNSITDLILKVGQSPANQTFVGGYNGGGSGAWVDLGTNEYGENKQYGFAGGGATDIRLNSTLNSRIMVAAGGGGSGYITSNVVESQKYAYGGAGGGLTGESGLCNYIDKNDWSGTGGTQTSGGYAIDEPTTECRKGKFGLGGYSASSETFAGPGGGRRILRWRSWK